MRTFLTALALLLVAAGPGAGQESRPGLVLGEDVYRAGGTVILAEEGVGNAFLAGERVRLGGGIDGSAHLAGRRVEVAAPVGGALYAAGMDLGVEAPVAGGATLAGYEVIVEAPVGGSLRASGVTVRVTAPVAGTAFLIGREVVLDAPVEGDVAISADALSFGPEARVGGRLVLWGDADRAAAVPEAVVPADRLELRERPDPEPTPPAAAAGGYAGAIAVLALLATFASIIAPIGMEVMRDAATARPLRTLGLGFITLSATVGAAFVVALTVIGLVLVPAVLLVAVLSGLAGYVVAVYMLGASLVEAARRREPEGLGARALAALTGAVIAGLVFLVPFVGWLFMLTAILFGVGALARAAFGPRVI
jgi:hypothetical protein